MLAVWYKFSSWMYGAFYLNTKKKNISIYYKNIIWNVLPCNSTDFITSSKNIVETYFCFNKHSSSQQSMKNKKIFLYFLRMGLSDWSENWFSKILNKLIKNSELLELIEEIWYSTHFLESEETLYVYTSNIWSFFKILDTFNLPCELDDYCKENIDLFGVKFKNSKKGLKVTYLYTFPFNESHVTYCSRIWKWENFLDNTIYCRDVIGDSVTPSHIEICIDKQNIDNFVLFLGARI